MGFRVAGAPLVVPLEEVRELVYYPRTTPIPGCRTWLKGVANIRGRLMTVVDLGDFLTGSASPVRARSRVLGVRSEEVPVGLLLEHFAGLRHLRPGPEQAAAAPPRWLAPYTRGVVRDQEGDWHLLDLERLLQSPEFLRVAV